MSLINQMLKDLEKSARTTRPEEKLLSGLRSQFADDAVMPKKHIAMIVIFFILAAGMLLLLPKKPATVLQVANKVTNKVVNPSIPFYSPGTEASDNSVLVDAMLTGIALQVQQETTSLRFMLDHPILYHLTSDTVHHQLSIIFDNTRLLAALPKMNYTNSGILGMQAYKDENNNLKLVLQLNRDAEIKSLNLNHDGKATELQLDLHYVPFENANTEVAIAPAKVMPVLIKNPIVEDFALRSFEKAEQLMSLGQLPNAINVLKNSLRTIPQDEKNRVYLTELLMQADRKAEAMQVVNQGLQLNPKSFALTKLKARLWVDQGNIQGALRLLTQAVPAVTSDPEYHALMAALYQRAGDTNSAAMTYKRLLALQPSNAKWWVGLGIAFEGLGNTSAAQDAYANADTIGGLDPELKSYLSSKLHTA